MTPERLAEIREAVEADAVGSERELLAEVDRLTRQLIVRTDQRDVLVETKRKSETKLRRDLGELIADCEHHAHRQAGGPQVHARSGEWVWMQDVLRRLLRTLDEGESFWKVGAPERVAYDARMGQIKADQRKWQS